jgi:fructokinase
MILCCGEALIDMVPLKIAHIQDALPLPGGGMGFAPYPGGSPYNTALAVGRLGAPVRFLGRISKDFFGGLLLEGLAQNKVQTDLIIRSDAPSSLAFVKLAEGKEPEYAFYTEGTADRSFSPADLPARLPENISCILFGSIAMTMEPVATAIESLITRENQRGDTGPVVSLDPNIRPFMISDREAYIKRFEGWLGESTILKISAADLGFMYPETAVETALLRLLQLGPSLGIATLGSKGALAMLRRGKNDVLRVTAPVIPVTVADTIGAGDTFHGAFLARLELTGNMSRSKLPSLSEAELTSALAFANKAAALVCARPGADPPTLKEMEAEGFY